jgi:TPR repeat protein
MILHLEALLAFECGNKEVGFNLMMTSATNGNPTSQYFIGKMLWDPSDFDSELNGEAISWFYRAIESGSEVAMQHLGMILVSGDGVERDVSEGERLLEMAGDHGNPDAYLCLGLMYMSGKSCAPDYRKARNYFELASRQGIKDAHSWVMHAEEYLNGDKPNIS